jgi:hypothetical protein
MFFFIRHRSGPMVNGRTKGRVLGFSRSPAKRHKKAFLNTCLRRRLALYARGDKTGDE